MNLKEELITCTEKALNEKLSESKIHYQLVKSRLKDICFKAAKSGQFLAVIDTNEVKLSDGLPITVSDVEIFASENNLIFMNIEALSLPVLCWVKGN